MTYIINEEKDRKMARNAFALAGVAAIALLANGFSDLEKKETQEENRARAGHALMNAGLSGRVGPLVDNQKGCPPALPMGGYASVFNDLKNSPAKTVTKLVCIGEGPGGIVLPDPRLQARSNTR